MVRESDAMAFDDHPWEVRTAGQLVATGSFCDEIRDVPNLIKTREEVKDLIGLSDEFVQRCEDGHHNDLRCDELAKG
jgi:hypothetical protein